MNRLRVHSGLDSGTIFLCVTTKNMVLSVVGSEVNIRGSVHDLGNEIFCDTQHRFWIVLF